MDFPELSIVANAAIFIGAAVAVWSAGVKLARFADAIAEVTGAGRELLGILLLGGVTSLPELAVATTATLRGTPELSVNDVLGSASINLVVLAVADAVSGRNALTSIPGSPLLLVQGVFGMLILALAAAPALAGDTSVLGIGAWSWIMLAGYMVAVRIMASSRAGEAWSARKHPEVRTSSGAQEASRSLQALIWRTVAAAAVILVAGFLLARTGESLAGQTGMGTSFFAAVFLALATSLPEWSTVIAATRLRRYEMAVSDIFGTNLFNVMIIVYVDALHRGRPVMLEAGSFAAFGAVLALVLTSFLLIGMLEGRNRTVLRMGWDSVAVLGGYIAGLFVLNQLR